MSLKGQPTAALQLESEFNIIIKFDDTIIVNLFSAKNDGNIQSGVGAVGELVSK